MMLYRTLPLKVDSGFGPGRIGIADGYLAPDIEIGYSPRFMWDVGASEQDITNVMEGIGGRGGYGTLSPPFMGWYGCPDCEQADVKYYPMNTDPGCSSCQKFGADDAVKGVYGITAFLLLGIGALFAVWYKFRDE